jgi:hypothetical protein
MKAILAGFVMLLPVLIALIVLVGVPFALGVRLFSYLRAHLPGKHPIAARVVRARDRRLGHDRRHRAIGVGSDHQAMSA